MNVTSALPAALEFRRYQVPVAGSHSPTVSMPSPFQSPAIGRKVAGTLVVAKVRSAFPAVLLFRSDHVVVDGVNKPIVVMPSPFQSPTIGFWVEFVGPNAKAVVVP